jgi:hypothetical protein
MTEIIKRRRCPLAPMRCRMRAAAHYGSAVKAIALIPKRRHAVVPRRPYPQGIDNLHDVVGRGIMGHACPHSAPRQRPSPGSWHIYFGGVRVGWIGERAGVPHDGSTRPTCLLDPPKKSRLNKAWSGGQHMSSLGIVAPRLGRDHEDT